MLKDPKEQVPNGIERERVRASEEDAYQAEVREEAGLWDLVVYLLSSLPAAIIAVFILAVLATVGTLIPQEIMGVTQADFIAKYGEAKYRLLRSLGFTNIYSTVYFNIVFLWVAISAIVCSLTRLKRTLRLWARPKHGYSRRFFTARKLPHRLYRESIPESAEELEQLVKRAGFRTHLLRDPDDSASIYADRGFLRKWAAVVFHFAIIFIILGGIIGRIYGFEGTSAVREGESATVIAQLTENKSRLARWLVAGIPPYRYELTLNSFRIEYDQHVEPPAFFEQLPADEPDLRDYYRYYIKDYVSDLTVRYDDREKCKLVKVNHPLTFGGTSFYQTSYVQQGYVAVSFDGEERDCPVSPGSAYQVRTDGKLHEVSSFVSSPTGSEVLYHPRPQGGSFPVKAGPLFRAGVEAGELEPIGLFQIVADHGAETHYKLLNTTDWVLLEMSGHEVKVRMAPQIDNVSIFQYKRDPGTGVVFVGWIVLILGIILTMYVPFVQVHLRWEPGRVYCFSRVTGAADRASGYRRIEKTLGIH